MDRYVTATEANQRFSELLREVGEGESFTVTSRGRPVARMVPPEKGKKKRDLKKLWDEMDKLNGIVTGPWKREDLYDR